MGDLSSQGQLWLMKAAMSGNAFRLPDKLEPGKFEQTINLWYTCFCGNMKSNQVKAMRNFKFLWRRDDDKIATRPNRGVATNLKQLQFLMSSGRIDRSDFPSIKLADWAETESFQGDLVCEAVPATFKASGDVETEAIPQTKSTVLKTIDAIVNGVTNGFYKDETDEEDVGATAAAYFKGAKDAVEAMEAVYSNMVLYLPNAIVPSFALGSYGSYDSLMSALRRFYGEDECQQTMLDIIRKIIKLVKKDQRMEQKIAEFRELAHQLMIVNKDDWIKPRDFTDDRTAYMEAAENYGPFTNTMLLAMVFSHNIPEQKWPSIQALFHARTTDISYKGWHENRPELYKILDSERKSSRAISGVSDETIAYANNSGWKKNSKKSGKSKNSRGQKSKNSNNSNNSKKQSSSNGGGSKSIDRMCLLCTQHKGKPVYHDPPFGGGKNCRFTKDGKPVSRQSRRLNSVQQNSDVDGGDSQSTSHDNNDQCSDEEYASDPESDVGMIDEEFYPGFGGGFGSQI